MELTVNKLIEILYQLKNQGKGNYILTLNDGNTSKEILDNNIRIDDKNKEVQIY